MSDVSLTLLVLKTRQVEQFRRFYQTLGMEMTEERHGKGPVHFSARAGTVVVEVYPLGDDGNPVDFSTRLGFGVENLAEVIRGLEAIGTNVVKAPKETDLGWQAVVKDPDGRSVELTQRG
jgi:lactoylglutathione lyase